MERTVRVAAIVLTTVVLAGCTSRLIRDDDSSEFNLAFVLDKNLPIAGGTVAGIPARLLLGTSQPESVVDESFAGRLEFRDARSFVVSFGRGRTSTLAPSVASFDEVADIIVGRDIWRDATVTVDYRRRLFTVRAEPPPRADMWSVRFTRNPSIPIVVGGRTYRAIVDTTSPDSLVLPTRSGESFRTSETVRIGPNVITTDVAFKPVRDARIGNRLLSNYLVVIDYKKQVVSLWRDPLTITE